MNGCCCGFSLANAQNLTFAKLPASRPGIPALGDPQPGRPHALGFLRSTTALANTRWEVSLIVYGCGIITRWTAFYCWFVLLFLSQGLTV